MGSRTGSSPHRDPSPRLAACLSFPGSSLGAVGRLSDPFRNIPGTAADGRPCPFPRRAGMGAPRHPPSGRPPWVGVWRGPPPTRPWPRGTVQARAGPASGAVPRRSRPGGGGTQWDQFNDWVVAGGAPPPRWLWGHSRSTVLWEPAGGGCLSCPPPPALASLALGMGAMCRGPGRAAGCWVDRASVSPCPSLLWCSGIPGGGGTVSAPSSPPAPVQPGGCPVCVGPTVFGVCPGRMLLLALLVAGLAGKHQGPCPSWGELGAGGPRRGLVWPPPPHMRLAPPPARPRQMCCSCLVPGPIRLGPPGGADAPPPRGSAGRPAGAVGVGTGICWRWGCRRAAGSGSGPVGCCVLCLRCGEMGSAVICAWCWGLPHSPWAWVQGGPVAPPLA